MVHRTLKTVAVASALCGVLAACGSSAGSTPTSGSSTAGSSSGAAASASSGSGSSEVEAAKTKVEEFKKEPTSIGVTEPLKAKPQPGGTFVWMKCDVGQCTIEGDGIKAATEAIGWTYKEISYKSADPATLVSALQQALTYKPTVVALSGLPRAVWESAAKQYQAAGVPIVVGYVGGGQANVADPVIGEVGGDADVSAYGDMLAQWFIADSDAKGGAALLSVNDFPVLKTFSDSFKKSVAAGCSACKVTEVNATIPQITSGQAVTPLISAIQKDPSIGYVMSANMPFITGILGQLSAAGLKGKVKVAGESADIAALQLLKSGEYAASTGLALKYTGWLMVDEALRHLQGMTIQPNGGNLPKQLLTPDVSFDISDSYDKPADFQAQFKKLWQVG